MQVMISKPAKPKCARRAHARRSVGINPTFDGSAMLATPLASVKQRAKVADRIRRARAKAQQVQTVHAHHRL